MRLSLDFSNVYIWTGRVFGCGVVIPATALMPAVHIVEELGTRFPKTVPPRTESPFF